jgi:hypothetical protein
LREIAQRETARRRGKKLEGEDMKNEVGACTVEVFRIDTPARVYPVKNLLSALHFE